MGVSQGMEEEFVHKILRNLTLVGMFFLASMLSGCTIPKLTLNSEDLYSLPTLPAKYTELNTQLNEILESGAEYAAPTSGANIQSVQLVDLDGDGREEAVAFFRNAAEEKPLKIYIFTATEDSYQKTELIEGSGIRTWMAMGGWSFWWGGRPPQSCRFWRYMHFVQVGQPCWYGVTMSSIQRWTWTRISGRSW